MIIGAEIKTCRKSIGLSQLKLAARLQIQGILIDSHPIFKVLTGRRSISNIEIIFIAEVLQVKIPWLLKDAEGWKLKEI